MAASIPARYPKIIAPETMGCWPRAARRRPTGDQEFLDVTTDYVESLPAIYRDILAAFPDFAPTRKAGYGLAFQSLYSALNGKYSLGEIQLACEEMARGGAMEIKHEIFALPTPLGEEIIAAVTGRPAAPRGVPPFNPPPAR